MTEPALASAASWSADEFPVDWNEPRDAELTWEWDDMHMPTALLPLAGDYVRILESGFAYGYRRLDLPIEIKARIWNGYAYFAADVNAPEDQHESVWALRTERARAQIPLTEAYWQRSVQELRSIYDEIDRLAVDTMPLADLADAWLPVWTAIGRTWQIHFYAIRGPYQVLEDLADLYEAIVPGAAPGEAMMLIAGADNELQHVERDLEALVALAAAEQAIGTARGGPMPSSDAFDGSPSASTFLEARAAFLAEHGHLGQAFDDLAQASWGEAPNLLDAELAKRLANPPAISAEERRRDLAAEADVLAAAVRERLAGDAETLARFEATLAAARAIGPLTEVHNYWIDRRSQATLRRFAMRVGRRLVAAGVIDTPEDILLFSRTEVPPIAREPADRRAFVADRRAEHARWAARQPPRQLGKPSEPMSEGGPPDRFDGAHYEADGPDELRGTGASAGIVRGPARVVFGPEGFAAVQAGDVIVCPSSNPSWIPVFAIAAGLVTNTGGVLSHAAVVAREFGLPAVVGTGDATSKVADGRLVELDGTSGIVRLL